MGVPHPNKSCFAFPSRCTFCGLDDVPGKLERVNHVERRTSRQEPCVVCDSCIDVTCQDQRVRAMPSALD